MIKTRRLHTLLLGLTIVLGLWCFSTWLHEFNALQWDEGYLADVHEAVPIPVPIPPDFGEASVKDDDEGYYDGGDDGGKVYYGVGDSSGGMIEIHDVAVAVDEDEDEYEDGVRPSGTSAPALLDYEEDVNTGVTSTPVVSPSALFSPSPSPSFMAKSNISDAEVAKYVRSIMDYRDNTTIPRLACPAKMGKRYEHLRINSGYEIKYFFALDLYQSAGIISRLMSSIVEAIRFLGPQHCAVSVIEGRSDDGTYEILSALKTQIESMGSRFYLETSSLNPKGDGVDRVAALAELRNMALVPLTKILYAPDAMVIFFNDISLCAEDILELIHQHTTQSAHMTCAYDWLYAGTLFYDVWVSRSMAGNTFFEIPQDGSWDYRDTLFFDDPDSKERYAAFKPVQAYACWGGMATIDAAPFATGSLKFRAAGENECYMGEPTMLAKDMWRQGLGRILTVPTVNVAYSDEEANGTKINRGYVGDRVDLGVIDKGERFEWEDEPPGMVKCLVDFDQPSWVKPF